MLTQGPAPNPKCKLNNSPFLTIPHLSFVRLSHLYQDCHAHCIGITNNGWGDQIGEGWLIYT